MEVMQLYCIFFLFLRLIKAKTIAVAMVGSEITLHKSIKASKAIQKRNHKSTMKKNVL